ncbi:MAG: sialate O-acetylesterase [Opitutales bacterium]|jgi:sialate O-acetylesterase|nr:sialate O-acetylesterase [Opitutales bacterium]MDP4777132.1 sialate O-acetylesterase [Opitutales bacterium]
MQALIRFFFVGLSGLLFGVIHADERRPNVLFISIDDMRFTSPTVLFNAMINPLIGLRIRGVIWYQGESNIKNDPEKYIERFPAMITRWRELWGQGDFPFYYVQIAPFEYGAEKSSWIIRDAQLKTMEIVPNVGMATTGDVGDRWLIHPGKKQEVGERLSYWALHKTYGFKSILCGGPMFKALHLDDGNALVEFECEPMGFTTFDKPLTDFQIAGSDRVFHPAKATIKTEWNKPASKRRLLVEVVSEKVPNPVAVRYGWSNWFEANLFDLSGNPASPFRTDDWTE